VWGDSLPECVRACATGQKVEVLEETLHLHRKRVTKLYKKVDLQQKDLNDAKNAYQCSQDRILELKTALQVQPFARARVCVQISERWPIVHLSTVVCFAASEDQCQTSRRALTTRRRSDVVRQAETHNVEQLNAALNREKIAYHDLQRRYSALEVHKSHDCANVQND
jgi:hypothetical protein